MAGVYALHPAAEKALRRKELAAKRPPV